jgi:hypothetical protein
VKRPSKTHLNATATLALACATALVFGVATVQARPTHTDGSRAADGSGETRCTLVISGAPWRIRAHTASGTLAGDKYTLTARNMSCSSLRSSVARFTHQQGSAQIKGPSGFKCVSFSTAASGNKLLYSGACMHPPHNDPFFEWGPKVR